MAIINELIIIAIAIDIDIGIGIIVCIRTRDTWILICLKNMPIRHPTTRDDGPIQLFRFPINLAKAGYLFTRSPSEIPLFQHKPGIGIRLDLRAIQPNFVHAEINNGFLQPILIRVISQGSNAAEHIIWDAGVKECNHWKIDVACEQNERNAVESKDTWIESIGTWQT